VNSDVAICMLHSMAENHCTGSLLSVDNAVPLSLAAWLVHCSHVFEVFLFFISTRQSLRIS
jgi:hypothetical protein